MKEVYLSKEGLQRLQAELSHLKNIKRKEIIERIQEAKFYGDLAENAEYEAAKNEQAFVEGRILELESTLKKAKIITKSQTDKVAIGSKVRVKSEDEEETFILVNKTEADPKEGKISYDSPLGRSLLGKGKGDMVEAQTPTGIVKYKIVEIE
jgi:transcription elongation factor GreA